MGIRSRSAVATLARAATIAATVAAVGLGTTGCAARTDGNAAQAKAHTASRSSAPQQQWFESKHACVNMAKKLVDAGFGQDGYVEYVDDYGNRVSGSTYVATDGQIHDAHQQSVGGERTKAVILELVGPEPAEQNMMLARGDLFSAAARRLSPSNWKLAEKSCAEAVAYAAGATWYDLHGAPASTAPAPSQEPTDEPTDDATGENSTSNKSCEDQVIAFTDAYASGRESAEEMLVKAPTDWVKGLQGALKDQREAGLTPSDHGAMMEWQYGTAAGRVCY